MPLLGFNDDRLANAANLNHPDSLLPPSFRIDYLHSKSTIELNIEIDSRLSETVKGNENRYKQALSMFPELERHGVTPPHVMAVIRNEISHYDSEDQRQDEDAKKGKADANSTLGYAQISHSGVSKLRNEFPQLDRLLHQQGLANNSEGNQRALVTPHLVPYIATAKLASIASVYEHSPQKGIDITPRTIIYGYNADVYFSGNISSNDDLKVGHHWRFAPGAKKVFPGNRVNQWIAEAAEASSYVDGVYEELKRVSSPFYLRQQSLDAYG